MRRTEPSKQRTAVVEAARRVMTEVWQVLGSYHDAMVIIGGWVPELLISNAERPHTGSIDVDLLLDPKRLARGRYASMLELLIEQGYERVPGKQFQLVRTVRVGRRAIPVAVDFLIPAKSKAARGAKRVSGFRPIDVEG